RGILHLFDVEVHHQDSETPCLTGWMQKNAAEAVLFKKDKTCNMQRYLKVTTPHIAFFRHRASFSCTIQCAENS
ncbi:hypothetical protein, partial [Candidatus Electronema sp. TJ]|uniref:hypothetical protein n=1 Tax=Candidatus Electronema sp. TJ TaxID=3401573 RepID=UPI003AA8CC56